MPGRYKITAPLLKFKKMALMNYDQDFSPADDMYSYWDSPNCYPETYSFFPPDVTIIETAVLPSAQRDVNSLEFLIDGPAVERSSSGSLPFTERESSGFCFCKTFHSSEHTKIQDYKSPNTQHTSLCGIEPQATAYIPACAQKKISLSPSARKTESACSDDTEIETAIEPAPRKRGRPRINRKHAFSLSSSIDATSASSSVCRPTSVPHKQVERKYREGLNSEMERLRKAVPTLLQSTGSCVMGVAKPSKGMVLAAAINYIVKIELERDSAINEIERLGGNFRVAMLD